MAIETMNEASERIKAYSCIAPSAAMDSDMQSVCERLISYADNQLLCNLCSPKPSHAFNSVGLKRNNQVQ